MAIREEVYGYFIPSVTLIGIGAAKQIPSKIKALGGTKPLIVTDKGITGAGITKQITDLLDEAGMKYVVYDETIPNPTDTNVHAGVEVYKKNGCDSLITLGGGSSHDCGKGVGLVIANGGKIHDFEGVDKSSKPMPPYLAVNTTAGTASEMTRFCIITDTSRHVKMAIVDWRVTPGIAVDDPLLMMGMPPALTAATGMDALTHAVEAYVSTIATPMTDSAAEKAIELIATHLRPAVANGSDIVAREGMCYAQYLAGMAFNNASLGHVHAMAHQLCHPAAPCLPLQPDCQDGALRQDRQADGRECRRLLPPRCGRTGTEGNPEAVDRYRYPRRSDRARQALWQGCQGRGYRHDDRQRPEGCLRSDQSALSEGRRRHGHLHGSPLIYSGAATVLEHGQRAPAPAYPHPVELNIL